MSEYTVGDLKRALEAYPENAPIKLEEGLTIAKLDAYGDGSEMEVYIHTNEIQAELSKKFREDNPHIIVAFCRVDMGENEQVAVVSVPRL